MECNFINQSDFINPYLNKEIVVPGIQMPGTLVNGFVLHRSGPENQTHLNTKRRSVIFKTDEGFFRVFLGLTLLVIFVNYFCLQNLFFLICENRK